MNTRYKLNAKKRRAYADAVCVHFNDEAPRIGSGVRRVVVESIGPKWVKLRAPSTGTSQRIKRAVWNDVARASSRRLST